MRGEPSEQPQRCLRVGWDGSTPEDQRDSEQQKGNDASTLHGVGEITLLLNGQTGETAGKNFSAFGDELLEEIHILVIDGITGFDRRETLLERSWT